MLEERYDLKKTANTKEEHEDLLEELRAFAKLLNAIKENRPNSNTEIWITIKSNTKGNR